MQLEILIGARRYRVHEANFRIVGIEMQVAETHSQRSPLSYWRQVWRVGRPMRQDLLPVVEAAIQRLPGMKLADEQALPIIRWLVDAKRAEVPPWIWPDKPARQPQQKQHQFWRQRRAEGGWPPP